jgi:hypothetical protein
MTESAGAAESFIVGIVVHVFQLSIFNLLLKFPVALASYVRASRTRKINKVKRQKATVTFYLFPFNCHLP